MGYTFLWWDLIDVSFGFFLGLIVIAILKEIFESETEGSETATTIYRQTKVWLPYCKRCNLRKRECICSDQELDDFSLRKY